MFMHHKVENQMLRRDFMRKWRCEWSMGNANELVLGWRDFNGRVGEMYGRI